MKLLIIGLAFGLSTSLFARGPLQLKLEPESKLILTGSPQEVVLKIDLTALPQPITTRRTPLNLAVVLDRSGSMTGAKIEKARQAAMELVDQLAPEDIFSLVAYSSDVEVLVPAQRVEDKESLKQRIAHIRPGGSTALHAGVESGAKQLGRFFDHKKINRVMLLSDGLANVGPSSPRDLRELGGRLARKGIAVTTIGLGDDYNEDLMAGLAEASDANYYYVQDTEKLPQIFAKELGELLTITARDIRIEVTCADGVRPIGFIGRPETFQGRTGAVKLNSIASGQNRYVFVRCQMEELKALNAREVAAVKVEYVDQLGGRQRTISETASVGVSADQDAVAAAANRAVQAQKALLITAEVKDQAIACADAGDYKQAGLVCKSQVIELSNALPQAPAELRPQLERELQLMQARAADFDRGNYSQGSRKALQSESWSYRNAK